MNRDKRSVTAAAKRLGCKVTEQLLPLGGGTIYVDAPDGRRFRASGTHCIVAHWESTRASAWEDLAERIEMGVEPCPPGGDLDCDIAECPAFRPTPTTATGERR